MPVSLGYVYLLQLDPPLAHARHYLGWTADLDERIATHQAGRGSPLIAAAVAAGSTVCLARSWARVDRRFERRLKRRKETPRFCPICVAAYATAGRGLLDAQP